MQTSELTVQQVTAKVKEMISEGLGFGSSLNEGLTALRPNMHGWSYAVDNQKAYVGYATAAIHNKIALGDDRHRANLADDIELAWAIIEELLMRNSFTPSGINWRKSVDPQMREYFAGVTDQIAEIYKAYVQSLPNASFTVSFKLSKAETEGVAVDLSYEMTYGDQVVLIEYPAVVLAHTLVPNVTEHQLRTLAGSVHQMATAVLASNPFEAHESELHRIGLDFAAVLVNTVGMGKTNAQASQLYEAYLALLTANKAMLATPTAIDLESLAWDKLSVAQQSYISTVVSVVWTLFNGLIIQNAQQGVNGWL